MALLFEQALDLRLAAAEVGVPADVFAKALESPRLAREVGELKAGLVVKRDKFVGAFGLIVAELALGKFVPPVDGVTVVDDRVMDLGGGVKLELVAIPAGEFQMGSPETDKDAEPDEKPRHKVTITREFRMGK
jgi:formylglycine-generating enzyme required for sulfatase activity